MSQYISVLAAMALFCAISSNNCGVRIAKADCPNSARQVRSEPVSLGAGEYSLTADAENHLTMEFKDKEQTLVQTIRISDLTKSDVDAPGKWENGKICDIALSRWSKTSLVAVIKVREGDTSRFWCLTFVKIGEKEKSGDELRSSASIIFRGSPDDKILALSGTRDSITITAVIGRFSNTRPGELESGFIVIDYCGTPGATGGRGAMFTPEYKREILDEK